MAELIDYKAAGVDRARAAEALTRIAPWVAKTQGAGAFSPAGGFAGFLDLSTLRTGYKQPILVQTMDGLGTKSLLAKTAQDFQTAGADLVAVCANDLLVYGARPLSFLDYIASAQLEPWKVEALLQGMASACAEQGIAILGGETAEMPGVYQSEAIDLVGCMTGIAEKAELILGKSIQIGDAILGLASSGLHSNGYSLARKLLPGRTAGLLAPHLNYTQPVLGLLEAGIPIQGMAHISGGGLIENIPRMLPADTDAILDTASWPCPAIFNELQALSGLDFKAMAAIFNMGIGFVLILPEKAVAASLALLQRWPDFACFRIGHITEGSRSVQL